MTTTITTLTREHERIPNCMGDVARDEVEALRRYVGELKEEIRVLRELVAKLEGKEAA